MLALSIALAGCAAAPRQLKDNDLLTKHVSVNLPVTDAYANLRQGFRYCGIEKYGFPDCKAPAKDGAVLCDIYPDKTTAGKANRALGRIQLSPETTGTKAVFRVRKNIANNEEILTAWEIFMSGRVREVCP